MWFKIKRFLLKPVFDFKIKKQVKQTFYYRDILETVRKREEFKLKLLEAQKKNREKEIEKYTYYIETLDWVLRSK
jgi:hypothetical protein